MTQAERMKWPATRIVLVVLVVSVIAGSSVGFSVSTFAKYQTPQTREINVFSYFLPFNETLKNIPHDVFYPDRILVYKGDTVVIHFYNIDNGTERHSFTIDAPYNINIDIPPQNHPSNATFVANVPGIFRYYCVYHIPTMEGFMEVLG
jgi:plastocyanin